MKGVARNLRNIAGLMLLLASARFAFVNIELSREPREEVHRREANTRPPGKTGRSDVEVPQENADEKEASAFDLKSKVEQGRLDLDQIAEPASPEAEAWKASEAGQAHERRLLVDLGPERSQVFVNGRKVGQTPYGGQTTCANGDKIKVVVLPPEGMPLTRELSCSGTALIVGEGRD